MSNSEITWISASSSLTGGAFVLFFGKLADFFGRKSLFISSLFLYTVFCLATGFVQTPIALDTLNGVIGLMSAAAVPPAVGSLGATYDHPSKRKNYAFACFSAGNPLGFIMGTIFSGLAAHLFNWRASFHLLAIIYLFITIIAAFTVPKDDTAKQPFNMETLKRFDIVGALLTITGIGLLSSSLRLVLLHDTLRTTLTLLQFRGRFYRWLEYAIYHCAFSPRSSHCDRLRLLGVVGRISADSHVYLERFDILLFNHHTFAGFHEVSLNLHAHICFQYSISRVLLSSRPTPALPPTQSTSESNIIRHPPIDKLV